MKAILLLLLLLFNVIQSAKDECNLPKEDKSNCGHLGISKKKCEEKGCCFKVSLDGSPWCYQKKNFGIKLVPVKPHEKAASKILPVYRPPRY